MRAQILPMRARKDQSCLLRSACYRHCLSAKCWSQCVCVALCVALQGKRLSIARARARADALCPRILCRKSPKQLFA